MTLVVEAQWSFVYIKPIPKPARFTRILLPKSHAQRTSDRDLQVFYHILEVDAERYAKQSWGLRVPQSWLENLPDESLGDASTFEDWWVPDLIAIRHGVVVAECPETYVQPFARTLVVWGPKTRSSWLKRRIGDS